MPTNSRQTQFTKMLPMERLPEWIKPSIGKVSELEKIQISNNQSLTEVPSPTFSLINEYTLNSLIIKHCDFYRLKDEKELDNLGVFENITEQITIIEWPNIIKKYKLENKIELFFEYDKNYKNRFITLSSKDNINFLNEFK